MDRACDAHSDDMKTTGQVFIYEVFCERITNHLKKFRQDSAETSMLCKPLWNYVKRRDSTQLPLLPRIRRKKGG